MEASYTLDDYVAALKRRRRIFFLVAVPLMVIISTVAMVLPNQYTSSAQIAVDLEGTNMQTLEPIQVATYADQYIAELRERVLAKDNLALLAEDADAFPQSEEDLPIPDRVRILNDGFFFKLETQPIMSDGGREVPIISGFRAGFQGADPEFAHKAANLLAQSFFDVERAGRTERASSTSNFLEEQTAAAEAKIIAYEKEVADFKVQNACCLPELKELNLATIQRAERDLEDIQPRMRTIEQDRTFLQSQLDEIRQQSVSTNRLDELEREYVRLVANYGPDHPDVARVRREIAAITSSSGPISAGGNSELMRLKVELAEAERKYSDIHPDVVSLKKRIEALEQDPAAASQVSADPTTENPRFLQLRAQLNALNIELDELRRRGPELRNKIEEYENRLTRTPQIESEYQALNRKLDSARNTFDNLERRAAMAQQTEALESKAIGARISQSRPAVLPKEPSGPARLGITIVGVMLAMSLGVAAIIMSEMLDSTIRSSKDVFRSIEIVPMTAIPVIQNTSSRAASRRRMLMVTSVCLAAAVGVVILIIGNLA